MHDQTTYAKPDTKDYLIELIDHYDYLLLNNYMSMFHEFIKECRHECSKRLYKIRESDLEALLWAKGSASPFQDMNCT